MESVEENWISREWVELTWTVLVAIVAGYFALWRLQVERKKDRQQRKDQFDKDQTARAEARKKEFAEQRRRWNEKQEEERREKKRLAALYVNPFLLACENLQSRLFNILDNVGLSPLRKQYPDGTYAEETLYLIAEYFAWQWCIYRYSSYAQDDYVVELADGISDTFATDKIVPDSDRSDGPTFRIFRLQQRALGQFVMRRTRGETGGEFDVVPFQAFLDDVRNATPLGWELIEKDLSMLRSANIIENVDSGARQRLAEVQNLLVLLLEYLEKEEEVSLFRGGVGTREPAKLPRGLRVGSRLSSVPSPPHKED